MAGHHLPCSPIPPFRGRTGSTLRSPPACPSWPEPTLGSGLLLTRNGHPFSRRPFRGQSSRPASSASAKPLPNPFGISQPGVAKLPSRHRADTFPLPGFRSAFQVASRISTPLRGFLFPSGSKRSTRSAPRRLTFEERPIALRSPTSFYLNSSQSDQRSRLATLRLVRCFVNLLEPEPSCPEGGNKSTAK